MKQIYDLICVNFIIETILNITSICFPEEDISTSLDQFSKKKNTKVH